MAKKFQARGGAQIGGVSASWPFAIIKIDQEKIVLKVMFIEKYVFDRSDEIKVERYEPIPILSSGVRTYHNNLTYPEKIVFYSSNKTMKKIVEITEEMGFSGQASTGNEGFDAKRMRGFPLKIFPILVVILGWSFISFLYEVIIDYWAIPNSDMASLGDFAALAMLFGLSVGIGRGGVITSIFMKKGRNVREIIPYLNLLSLVFGILLVVFILSKIVSIL